METRALVIKGKAGQGSSADLHGESLHVHKGSNLGVQHGHYRSLLPPAGLQTLFCSCELLDALGQNVLRDPLRPASYVKSCKSRERDSMRQKQYQ
jgi:hypothetical protein